MKLLFTKPFVKDHNALPKEIQRLTRKQLKLLLADPTHPSLQIKKMNDPREIWEGRITRSYRFTFQIKEDVYVLRRIGSHNILRFP